MDKLCRPHFTGRMITYDMRYTCITFLTHWGRVTHICVGNLTIIVSDNGLSPGRRQAITWTNIGILLIGPLGTNFSEMLIEIHTFSFKKIHLKILSGKWRPFCLGLNVLTCTSIVAQCWIIASSSVFQEVFLFCRRYPSNPLTKSMFCPWHCSEE